MPSVIIGFKKTILIVAYAGAYITVVIILKAEIRIVGALSICVSVRDVQHVKKTGLCIVKTIIVMRVIAKKHKAIIQDIVCSTNVVNVASRRRRVPTIVALITVLLAIARQTDI